ncbi:MAG TPA: hypothetical protein VJI13_06175 [Candidatus Norongarragalinales archaeon]|nr:hypothetical protein [Candidatus Norongarragalinales archaeon]
MLSPFPANGLEAYEISAKVNSPANNSPEILLPVQFAQKKLV